MNGFREQIRVLKSDLEKTVEQTEAWKKLDKDNAAAQSEFEQKIANISRSYQASKQRSI